MAGSLTFAWMGAGLIGLASLMPSLDRALSDPAQESGSAAIRRAADGQIYLEATIAGEPVRFMVDGSGDEIVLAGDDADRIGLRGPGGAEVPSLTLQSREFSNVPLRVVPDIPVSLIGRGWLARAGVAGLVR